MINYFWKEKDGDRYYSLEFKPVDERLSGGPETNARLGSRQAYAMIVLYV